MIYIHTHIYIYIYIWEGKIKVISMAFLCGPYELWLVYKSEVKFCAFEIQKNSWSQLFFFPMFFSCLFVFFFFLLQFYLFLWTNRLSINSQENILANQFDGTFACLHHTMLLPQTYPQAVLSKDISHTVALEPWPTSCILNDRSSCVERTLNSTWG